MITFSITTRWREIQRVRSTQMPFANLTPLYASWVAEWLGGSIPAETEATCQECALLMESAPLPANDLTRRIHPRTKCCGYYPKLTNFQVGRILNETDSTAAPAQNVVAARVQNRFMATPLVLDVPPAYSLLYAKSPYMGSALKLQCPYYVEDLLGGACGIWQHRNAICVTWFCKHSRGQIGWAFWRALEYLLQPMEDTLSAWCLTQLEITDDSLARILPDRRDAKLQLTPQELDAVVDEKAHRALWGNWAGREAEFYRECGRLVSALSAQRALEIGGTEVALRLRVARQTYRALISADLPRAVRPGSFRVQPLGDGQVQIVSYSEYAPLLLPAVVLNLLPYFEGRTVAEALAAIDAQEQIEMEPALVRKLLDFEILVAVEGGAN
jgi:hypothetical protein